MELKHALLIIALACVPSLALAQNQPGPSGPQTLTCTISGVVPLPTGAATASNQTDGSQKTQIMLPGGATAASFDIDGNFATSLTNIAGNDVNLGAGNIDTGTQRVVLATNQPSVATTEASAASIKLDVDKIPSQGQALAAASMPVVLPATQITALTPPAAITGFALETGGNLDTLVAATHLEDAASASGDRGMLALGQRRDNGGSYASADGDYETLQLFQGWLRALTAATDPAGTARPLAMTSTGALQVNSVLAGPQAFLPPCNGLRKTNCR